jgi:ubiquinone/menaquinone biosynthesis C-methylase UbiE
MSRLARRAELTELMDGPDLDTATLAENLRDIRLINRWLGWAAALTREVAIATRRAGLRECTLLDVATGSADLPLALVSWGRRHGVAIRAFAGDLSPPILAAARAEIARVAPGAVILLCCDARALPLPARSVDLVTCSLALHHLGPDDATAALCELGRVTRHTLIVSDLARGRLAYLGARLLAIPFRNPLTRHDAAVSVLRAYTRDELATLARAAGLEGARVRARFPFRLILTWSPPRNDGTDRVH